MADNIEEARSIALNDIASFLQLASNEEAAEAVNIELKVSYPEAKTREEIVESSAGEDFVVTVYGSVKQSIAKPFGL